MTVHSSGSYLVQHFRYIMLDKLNTVDYPGTAVAQKHAGLQIKEVNSAAGASFIPKFISSIQFVAHYSLILQNHGLKFHLISFHLQYLHIRYFWDGWKVSVYPGN